ncbi:hypothetical protein CIG19_06300 [Enterobacterales bacterium CwR94]|nr:hypothetical protein CIG19_06300 [Enterobacterales bacterium CwR94]
MESKIENLEKDISFIKEKIANIAKTQDLNYDLLLEGLIESWHENAKNPLAKYGNKTYSQNDEDGITLEILRRMGLTKNGTYAEYGVGNGLENNTLILASLGWRGYWVGGQDLAFDYTKSSRLHYIKQWITLDNINQLTNSGLNYLQTSSPDLISLDLDGNDYHFIEALLQKGLSPHVFIVEYNARFTPPGHFIMPYNPQHRWDGSDYFGASLMSLCELFIKFGYRLVCCNAQTGSNAFFVKGNHANLFTDVPASVLDIYVPPRYNLLKKYGHRISPKTIETLLA